MCTGHPTGWLQLTSSRSTGGSVERFLGPITDRAPGEAYVETAFRAILFTDIEGSTDLTQRLGDRAAMELVRGA